MSLEVNERRAAQASRRKEREKRAEKEIFVSPHALGQARQRRVPYLTAEDIDREIRDALRAGRQLAYKPKWCRLYAQRNNSDGAKLLAGQTAVWDAEMTTCWILTRQAVGGTYRYIVATTLGRTVPR